ncbi:MAG: UbiD family decarboxylase [Thermincola sp.]|jgi:2,5-furandicarboxylate decarboxylase 1|nr:UbiD family decarboxylase [Thermincola sp.]MDT3701842.1 UbiD family decarboxylase [Thermincola sp.]
MAYRDLREFLQVLEENGELLKVKHELNPRFEMSAALKLNNDGKAVQFNNVAGYPGKTVVGNVLGTRRRLAMLFGVTEDTLTQSFIDRKEQPIPPQIVESGPVKEVIIKDNIDLVTLLPALTYHEKDAGPYLTSAVTMAKDPVTGAQNMGLHRIQLKGGNRLGIFLANPPVATFLQKAEQAGQGLDVAIALGVDPAMQIGATVKATAEGPDKFAVTGGLKGDAVELTPAESVDLLVPARAEIVMEGRIIPGLREKEGPFGEATGHYFAEESPVIEIHTVTHRRDFILPVIQVWGAETDVLLALGGSAETIRLLKGMSPSVKDINFVPGTCSFHAVISVHGTTPAEVRRVMGLLLNMDPRIKQITVVDDDVNIYDMREVQWALATRFQADRDALLVTDLPGYVIDPSVGASGVTAKLGFDATKKGQDPKAFEKISLPPDIVARVREVLR